MELLSAKKCAAPPALWVLYGAWTQRLRAGLTCIAPLALGGDEDELTAWDDDGAAAGSDCGVAAGVDWVVDYWVAGGVVGREDGAGAGIWMYRGCADRVDRVGDWGMDFYAVGDCAYQYVFVFPGGGYGWGGALSIDRTFVFWGEGIRREV